VKDLSDMPQEKSRYDWWSIPALMGWLLFFSIGLAPEEFYTALRMWANVPTQRALVNNPYMLTLAMSGYAALFTWARCREANLGEAESLEKTLHVAIISLAAFLPFRLPTVLEVSRIPIAETRYIVCAIAAGKAIAWFWLSFMIIRYYTYARHAVFINMPLFLPSARAEAQARIAAEQAEYNDDGPQGTSAPAVEPFPPVTHDDHTGQ
jgi:hypothetical protein